MKVCIVCHESKPLGAFSPNERYRDGRVPRCKPCNAARARATRGRPRVRFPASFWLHVAPPNHRGCRLWLGARGGSRREYGMVWNGERPEMAHRVAYRLRYGEVPAGLVIDHRCRMTLCVNADHLEAVTHAENSRRGYGGNVAAGRDR